MCLFYASFLSGLVYAYKRYAYLKKNMWLFIQIYLKFEHSFNWIYGKFEYLRIPVLTIFLKNPANDLILLVLNVQPGTLIPEYFSIFFKNFIFIGSRKSS